ncbi:MAG: putative metal-binding motif-containing protein, partial [Deltaproteobacteria bacterium]|nr:putative metal-binding motif-containing protein [Deltaproteobacteria bacterium]
MRTTALFSLLALSLLACRKEEPVDLDQDGTVAADDCDDLDASAHPGAEELCDGVDNDCDGEIDNDPVDATTFFADADQDGYGNADNAVEACALPAGYVTNDTDCDDHDAAFHPGAPEPDCADPSDYNCDGSVAFADEDGDGFAACEDCDDARADVNPDAPEVCDEADNDCDGEIDEAPTDAPTWYQDADRDGHGAAPLPFATCDAPAGYVALGDDCDDLIATVYPDAPELCDGLVNACGGALPADEADQDGDGYLVCQGDCDDTDGRYHPNAAEADCADPADYNCDGSVGYSDEDGDGFAACEECDDHRADVFPGAEERCDGADNDCNSQIDDHATDALVWHLDADHDGYGDPAATAEGCVAPSSYVADATDCDDLDALVYPAALELCDGQANDCDGTLPEDEQDLDHDGFMSCEGDCNDEAAAARPGGTEVCDGLDNDCDGDIDLNATNAPTWYADGDEDGFGDSATVQHACEQPAGYVGDDADCDDTLAAVSPDADELCATDFDDDCDGDINEAAATDAPAWHLDADGDAFGRPGVGLRACEAPDG